MTKEIRFPTQYIDSYKAVKALRDYEAMFPDYKGFNRAIHVILSMPAADVVDRGEYDALYSQLTAAQDLVVDLQKQIIRLKKEQADERNIGEESDTRHVDYQSSTPPHWIRTQGEMNVEYWKCSECGYHSWSREKICPSCNARMEEK